MLGRLITNCTILFTSLLFCFFVAEIVCRLAIPDTFLQYEQDPVLMAHFKPNQDGILEIANGDQFRIKINEYGLRGKSLSLYPPRRVLLLGDSFTFGWGVTDDKTISTFIERSLGENIGVVNAGQPGFGIFQIQELSRRLLPIVRPEFTVVVVWEGLLARQPPTPEERENFFRKAEFLRRAKSISVFGTYVYRRIEKMLLSLNLKNWIVTMQAHNSKFAQNDDVFLKGFEGDANRLLDMRDEASRNGSKFAIVLWTREGFSRKDSSASSLALEARVNEWASKSNVPFLSLRETFSKLPSSKLIIPKDLHPTPLAQCVAGANVADLLARLGTGKKARPCAEDDQTTLLSALSGP